MAPPELAPEEGDRAHLGEAFYLTTLTEGTTTQVHPRALVTEGSPTILRVLAGDRSREREEWAEGLWTGCSYTLGSAPRLGAS